MPFECQELAAADAQRPVFKRMLKARAFLMVDHLARARLADVNDRMPLHKKFFPKGSGAAIQVQTMDDTFERLRDRAGVVNDAIAATPGRWLGRSRTCRSQPASVWSAALIGAAAGFREP